MDQRTNDQIIQINLSRTSEQLEEKILNWSIKIYGLSFSKVLGHIGKYYESDIDEKYKINSLKIGGHFSAFWTM